MKNQKTYVLSTILMIIMLQSCSDSSTEIPVTEEPKETTTVTQLSEGNQFLGWNLLNQEIAAKQDKNVIISPLSIQIALHMAANGAKGETLDEILKVIGCENCDPKSINEQTKLLTKMLSQQSGHPTLSLSNGFFYDPNKLTLRPTFQSSLVDYDCVFQTSDFNNQNASLGLINNWVKDKTNGKIDKILEEIKAEDIAFLINALYFKASWTEAFPEYMSIKRSFSTSKGTYIQADFIGTDRNIPHYTDQNKTMVVDIPFKDSTYTLSLIALENPTKNLDLALYQNLMSKLKYQRGIINLPRLKVTYENDIIRSLQSLGMKAAFVENKADFSNLGTAAAPIFINQLKHKVALDVSEKGADGSAVTSIGFGTTEAPPSLTFDRPFYILLRHVKTNTIIFAGKINDPSEH
jgi:serine protease inhibitor